MGFKDIIGKRIIDFVFGQDIITFETEEGYWSYSAEGDCCSHSWFESVNNPELFKDAVLLDVRQSCGDTIEDQPAHECLRIYFLCFQTEKGYVDIDMRNSSNGYYGGYVEGPVFREREEPKSRHGAQV